MYIAGLVIGIFSFIVGLIPFIGWLVIPFSLAAFIIGILGIKNKATITKSEHQMAIAALILGLIPLVIKTLLWA